MKKLLILTIVVICGASLSQAYGQVKTAAPARTETTIARDDRHSFEVSSEMFYLHYKEPNVMKNEGLMYGANLNYHYRNKIMLGLENRVGFGEVDYHSFDTGTSSNNEDLLLETRGVIGLDLRGEEFAVVPFTGFGYRYFYDDRGGSQPASGAGGYERNSHYLYSPIGAGVEYYINELWTVDLLGEYDIFWAGFQRSVMGDVFPGHPTLHNEQSIFRGHGFKVSTGVARKVNKASVKLSAFYHYWNVGESDNDTESFNGTTYRYDVPRNRTQEIGGRLAFLF
jgi:hypothetical protein